MPWNGLGIGSGFPFPTLGAQVADWVESCVCIPDGIRRGDPLILTGEQLRFVLNFYRVDPEHQGGRGRLQYDGGQLRRSQKWGKDPLLAAIALAEALGPATFDGWDAGGDPVGAVHPSANILLIATSEEQADNTWAPLLDMIRLGPLENVPGLDAGLTRVMLPGGGKIATQTSSARARLGARNTFVAITESHAMTMQGGFRRLASVTKRNAAGMGGRWMEATNAWDPTEASEAQITAEEAETDPSILVDTIEPRRVEDLGDSRAVMTELARQYGDSAQHRGGWVDLDRILRECQRASHSEPDRRRFFLNEIVSGVTPLVDPTVWEMLAEPHSNPLVDGEAVALGFDGSKNRDATALVGCRISDGKLFTVRVWLRPVRAAEDWRVPSAEVDAVMIAMFAAFDVRLLLADPYRWQDYLDRWSADHPGRVAEFPTAIESRMDEAIGRFREAVHAGMRHDGDPVLTEHMMGTVVVKGGRRKARPGDEDELATNYAKLTKKNSTVKIDTAVAAVLARKARGLVIEKNLMPKPVQEIIPSGAWR